MSRGAGKLGAVVLAGVIIICCVFGLLGLEKIPTGYVGVVYNMHGGVQNELLTQGFHWVSPTKTVKLFTVGNEQIVLSKDCRDGSEIDESFPVSTSDNANIKVSFQMSYRYKSDEVLDTFKSFKGMSGEDIMNNRVRTVLKSKVSETTSKYSIMQIYSGNREEINQKLTTSLNKSLGDAYGIEVIDASIIDVHPDEQLQKTIDDRVKAVQAKQKAEAEQQRIKVENENMLLEKEAAAEAVRIEAQAEADANRIISESITDGLLKKMEMEARNKHGWVEINGGSVITTKDK